MHRICTESKAAEALHPQVAGPVQGLVAGHVAILWVRHFLPHFDEHHLPRHEGTYLPISLSLFVVFFF